MWTSGTWIVELLNKWLIEKEKKLFFIVNRIREFVLDVCVHEILHKISIKYGWMFRYIYNKNKNTIVLQSIPCHDLCASCFIFNNESFWHCTSLCNIDYYVHTFVHWISLLLQQDLLNDYIHVLNFAICSNIDI